MATYRKKPVEIEARHFYPGDEYDTLADYYAASAALADWCGGVSHRHPSNYWHAYCITIATLEGVMHAEPGDWIIRGAQGEFHPVKDSIFREIYERVEEA